MEQIRDFLQGTLLYVQREQLCVERSLWDVVQQCVDVLQEKDLIAVMSHTHTLQVTKLGRATYKGEIHILKVS